MVSRNISAHHFPPSCASQLLCLESKQMSESKHSKAGLPSPSKIAGQWLMLSGLSSPHIFHKVQIISPQPCKTKCTCGSALDRSESRCAAYSLWFFQSRAPFPVIWKCWIVSMQPPGFKASFSQITLHCQVPRIDNSNNCICQKKIVILLK